MNKTINILILLLLLSCNERKNNKNERKNNKIDNSIAFKDGTLQDISKSWELSNLKLIDQSSQTDSNTNEKYVNLNYIKLMHDTSSIRKESTRSFILRVWLKNKILDTRKNDAIYVLERTIKGFATRRYVYIEIDNIDNSTYYLFNVYLNSFDSLKVENGRGYLRDLYYFSKQLQNQKIDNDYHNFFGDLDFLTITQFQNNSVTSNIILFHDRKQYDSIVLMYNKIDNMFNLLF